MLSKASWNSQEENRKNLNHVIRSFKTTGSRSKSNWVVISRKNSKNECASKTMRKQVIPPQSDRALMRSETREINTNNHKKSSDRKHYKESPSSSQETIGHCGNVHRTFRWLEQLSQSTINSRNGFSYKYTKKRHEILNWSSNLGT